MPDEPEPLSGPATRPTRRIDARSLRGLAHPLRMSILEAISLDGPATATGLAERLGENTGTVSWHLRHLAEHGFIEEETGRGTKRERWWRRTGAPNELNTADFRDDPGTRGALSVYLHGLVGQYFSRVTDYLNEDWDDGWRSAGTVSDWHDLRLTPGRLGALNAELMAVIARHTAGSGTDANTDTDTDVGTDTDPEALPVVVQLQSFPRKARGRGSDSR